MSEKRIHQKPIQDLMKVIWAVSTLETNVGVCKFKGEWHDKTIIEMMTPTVRIIDGGAQARPWGAWHGTASVAHRVTAL